MAFNDIVTSQVSGEYTDKVIDKSTLPGTDESKKNITFLAYWGKYQIDEAKQTISYHILASSEEDILPIETRDLVFKDDYLILNVKGKPWLNGSVIQATWRKWH